MGSPFLVDSDFRATGSPTQVTTCPSARSDSRLAGVFDLLSNVRYWDYRDRLLETGTLEDWQERESRGEETVPFELELWFRKGGDGERVERQVRRLVEEEGGEIHAQTVIPEIRYHGLLGELPIRAVGTVLDSCSDKAVLKADEIMFVRPVGQCVVGNPAEEGEEVPAEEQPNDQRALPSLQNPVVALLDGVPLANHDLLQGRLLLDDPDDLEALSAATERRHGSAMASIILHGELDADEQTLDRVLYVRPILEPKAQLGGRSIEGFPERVLPLDLIRRAVQRLFDEDGGNPPVAPTVKVINLSVGDPNRLFDRTMSAWARLLDWLSFRYQILFVVSAGNHPQDIEFGQPLANLLGGDPERVAMETVQALARGRRHRRLLSPAESINSVTVGAIHSDHSSPVLPGYTHDLLPMGFPSPVNPLGLGYRRGVKSDFLVPGGRVVYQEPAGSGVMPPKNRGRNE